MVFPLMVLSFQALKKHALKVVLRRNP